MKIKLLILTTIAAVSCSQGLKDGDYKIQLLTTNDVHGSWFDSSYVGTRTKTSLFAASTVIDSVRKADGADNVILIDAGDCLQGDNAAYYFNYVDTLSPHLFPRLASYMGYDAITVGNHDIETGHKVYDRVTKELNSLGIPFLAGNAIRNDNGKPYFPVYKILRKGGLKVAILGYTNPNMKAWLSESLWSGMHFESLIPMVQNDVDAIRKKEKPNVVIVSIHSGSGDKVAYEAQGMELYRTLSGVDFIVCSHDHSARVEKNDSICLINSGSHVRNIGHGTLTISVRDNKIVSKTLDSELIPVNKEKTDTAMQAAFRKDFEAVREFTTREVGTLDTDIRTREAFSGMCDYMNLIHTISLSCSPARISFAAPLTYNGFIPKGTLVYNDLFTIYPYENQLFVVKMTGKEIHDCLEYSYDNWIQTVPENAHVLKIKQGDDYRNSQKHWHFTSRTYNFDSAAGINYTVDITKPFGKRVNITTMASGEPFSLSETYPVAMTSYRASGGGGILGNGAGIDTDNIEERVVEHYPEIRDLLYNYLKDNGSIDPAVIGDPARIGSWKFIPQPMADKMIASDMNLVFGTR